MAVIEIINALNSLTWPGAFAFAALVLAIAHICGGPFRGGKDD